jgi:outer membrane murein-binding lipoprotein Lpp
MRFSSRRSPDRGGVPSGTRLPLRLGIAGAVALSALLLSGCVQPAPVKTPQAHATVKPLFASDADALAAATKALNDYAQMSDQILSEGGAAPARIEQFASRDALAGERRSFKSFREKGYRSVGSSRFSNPVLERVSDSDADTTDVVKIYACLELANVDVVDSSGKSVVSEGRPDRQAFEVGFDLISGSSRQLVVSSTETWTGEGVCV